MGEIPASEKTALEAVMEADEERIKLEALAEMLALETDDASQEYLMQVYERLDDLGADTAEDLSYNSPYCLPFPGLPERRVHANHAHGSAKVEDLWRKLRPVHEDQGRAGGGADEAV